MKNAAKIIRWRTLQVWFCIIYRKHAVYDEYEHWNFISVLLSDFSSILVQYFFFLRFVSDDFYELFEHSFDPSHNQHHNIICNIVMLILILVFLSLDHMWTCFNQFLLPELPYYMQYIVLHFGSMDLIFPSHYFSFT